MINPIIKEIVLIVWSVGTNQNADFDFPQAEKKTTQDSLRTNQTKCKLILQLVCKNNSHYQQVFNMNMHNLEENW